MDKSKATYVPQHHTREQVTETKWVKQYNGSPVQLTEQEAAELNAQFESTGVKYVEATGNVVASGASTSGAAAPSVKLPGNTEHTNADTGADDSGLDDVHKVRDKESGNPLIGKPYNNLVLQDHHFDTLIWPGTLKVGDTVNIAHSGYVTLVKPAPEAGAAGEPAAGGDAPEGSTDKGTDTEAK